MSRLVLAFGLSLALVASGCDDDAKKTAVDAGAPDAGSGPVLGGKLGQVVAAAGASASASPASAPKGAGSDAPPETGIFGPGEADKAAAKGAAPTVQILSEGSDPKAPIALGIEPGASQTVAVAVAVRMGPQRQLPTLEFVTALQIEKAKGKDDKDKGAKDAGPLRVTGTVKSVKPDAAQVRQMPKETLDAFDKLKGTEVRFALAPNGGGYDYSYSLPKGTSGELDLLVRGFVEALSWLLVPVPDKPVGAGAYWMITDRSPSSGIDTVRYRVARVSSIADGKVSVTLETRGYAADDHFDLPVGPEGMKLELDQVELQGKGSVDLAAKAFVPKSADLNQRLAVRLRPSGQAAQGRPIGLQLEYASQIKEPSH
jgi:hypothetical protein